MNYISIYITLQLQFTIYNLQFYNYINFMNSYPNENKLQKVQ